MSNIHRIVVSFIFMALLTSCNFAGKQEPTVTPTLTRTARPTVSSTPPPTATPALPPTQAFEVSEIKSLVVLNGFTLSVPFPLIHQVNRDILLISDEQNTLNASFVGDSYDDTEPLTDVIDTYLASLEQRGWEFTKGEPLEIEIDGVQGIAVALTATGNNLEIEGQAVAVSPRPGLVVFGLGTSRTDMDKNEWKVRGQPIFEVLLDMIEFTDTEAECPIATDESYGYEEENPVKVGGGDYEGPSRERAYLDHLRGLNGEVLSYEREGSLPSPSGETILDVYHVTGPGMDAVLYLDEYSFSEVQAPAGFTCRGAFPLSAP